MKKRAVAFAAALACLAAGTILFIPAKPRIRTVVHASSGGAWDPSVALEDSSSGSAGGMAQYAQAEGVSTSESASVQAVSNWNNYVGGRANWYFSSSDVTRIGDADWNARQAGPPAITASQMASATNQLIASTLATMGASQQTSLFTEYATVSTPNGGDPASTAAGTSWTNWQDPNISAAQDSDGTWTVTVSSTEFSLLKSFFQQYAPGMMSSGPNFYPGEAIIVFYSAATCDLGYGDTFTSTMASIYGADTGLYAGSNPFGDSGYVCKRPISTFLTETNLAQLYSGLGF